jgi:D-alanine-D-alanine ligase
MNGDDDAWLADILDGRRIPYIGPSAQTMKDLINKTATHRILSTQNISVPEHHQVDVGDNISDIRFPAFVKPSCESRSVGISDESVVQNVTELQKRVAFIVESAFTRYNISL